jgi:DUF4097 and DUF4098 domain-containing protein YvlB
MENVAGDFDVSTSNGGVRIAQTNGSFNISTSNGKIEFDGELVPGGDNRITTSNGSIEITFNGTASVELVLAILNQRNVV